MAKHGWTSWTQACKPTIKSNEADKAHNRCDILSKYEPLSWDNWVEYADALLFPPF